MPGLLGVDPGATGALALFSPDKSAASGLRWVVVDLPVMGAATPRRSKRGRGHAELNSTALRDWLRKFAPDHCFLEAMQFAVPGKGGGRKGLAGAMRFGALFGAVKAVLACCDVPTTLVQPQAWKRHYRLVGPEKERSRVRALELFPEAAEVLARKKDQNRAESMLIAAYGATRQPGLPLEGGALRVRARRATGIAGTKLAAGPRLA
jgi:hypothetical protein